MTCPDPAHVKSLVIGIDKVIEIDKNKENDLRFDVWETTPNMLRKLMTSLNIEDLPESERNSVSIRDKLSRTLARIKSNENKATGFTDSVIKDNKADPIALSIALYEMMEAVKGEADKSRNLETSLGAIAPNGILPGLPVARIAAVIGRKILFQKGYRIKSTQENQKTPVDVEALYLAVGTNALNNLETKGYVKFFNDKATIKDYTLSEDMGKPFQGKGRNSGRNKNEGETTRHTKAVALNEKTLGIVKGTNEERYFTDRNKSDITDSPLAALTDTLSAIRQITQPSEIDLPHTDNVMTDAEFRAKDDQKVKVGDTLHKVRKKLYEKPLKVNNAVHELLQLLHQEVLASGLPATKVIRGMLNTSPEVFRSLFGVKNSDLFSVDKTSSIAGQNLSKSTAIDDLAEYYDLLMSDGKPSDLHLPMKGGRNIRLYYLNSVLNPHASKQSRYMLTPGEQKVEHGSDNFDYLVSQVNDVLGGDLSYDEIVNGEGTKGKLEEALKWYDFYKEATTLKTKINNLSNLVKLFPGKDYVILITALQAVQDIRNPINGEVTTEFAVSEDATASGGTLTLFQALASDPNGNIKAFLERLGMLIKDDGTIEVPNGADVYTLMTEAIDEYIDTEGKDTLAQDPGASNVDVKDVLEDTLNLLFNDGDDVREFSKPATMVFVYQQGAAGAVKSIAESLADKIIDNLTNPKTREYLVKLLGEKRFAELDKNSLNDTVDLYPEIKEAIINSNMPTLLYELLGSAIKEKFLKENQERSTAIFNLVSDKMGTDVLKILPADAILDGKTANLDLAELGMPIAKVFEVMTRLPDGTDVITRKEILHKTIMDVSTIHGIDSALLYHALDAADFKSGVVVVHDQVIGTIEDVRAVVKQYSLKAKEILGSYDIHEQMLEALAIYHPEVVEDSKYQALLADVQSTLKEKRTLAEKFNENTTALIGSGDKHVQFAAGKKPNNLQVKGKTTPETKVGPVTKKAEVKPTSEKDVKVKGDKNALDVLMKYGSESSLIQRFLKHFDTALVDGSTFSFDTSSDTMTLDGWGTNKEQFVEAAEHEIIHAATVANIHQALKGVGDPNTVRDVKYFQKALKALKIKSGMSPELKARLQYIDLQTTDAAKISEFVAIMGAEKDIAREVYSLFDTRNTLKGKIEEFIKRIHAYVRALTKDDFKKDIDSTMLYGALNRTIEKGISDRIYKQEETIKALKEVNKTFGFNSKIPPSTVDFLNRAVARMITDRAEAKGKTIFSDVHEGLSKFPAYADVVKKLQGIYDGTEEFQALVHAITGEDVDKHKKAITLAEYAKTTAQKEDFIRKNLEDFDNITSKMSKEDKETLDNAITQIPLHDYFTDADTLNTVELIDQEVVSLEETLKDHKDALKDVKDLVNLNVHGEITGKIYNLNNYLSKESDYARQVRKLLTLKTIQAIGTDKFVALLENDELVDKLRDMVMANHLSLVGISGRENLRASGIPHSYGEGIIQEAFTLDQRVKYEESNDRGWVIVNEPTKETLGLAYLEVIDSTTLPGAFTDVKMSTSDISVSQDLKGYKNVLEGENGYKMILTDVDRKKMGALGAVQSLVRSTAHAISIQESEIIRNMLLEKETTFMVNEANKEDLKDIIQDKSKDNPWFLKADSITYGNLPPEVQARYKPVGNRASNVNKFDEKVTWVRKDISHWLLGGQSSSPFTNPKWKWGLRITKDLISMAKINMVITNPAKIAKDNMSNIAYLGVMGVSPVFAYSNYKLIMEQYGEYTEVKHQLLALKVQLIAKPDSTNLKAKEKALKNKLKQNPISSIEDKGFLNSLGSALISRESETLGGTQKDINTALTYLLKQEDGKNNYTAHYLMQLQKIGPEGEGFLAYLGGIVGKVKAGKEFESEMDKVSDRLSQIRSDKDMVAYASQFLSAPQSEAVRFGAGVTDLSDVMAKETYYRHLVAEGMDEETAKIKVLDSFPNYIENMPMVVQQLSDVGILMFPSFWMRIQKVIYRMAKDRPLSLATEEAIDMFLSTNIESIVDANIVTKATSWSGLLHSPFESIGVTTPFPTNAFNF